MTFNFDQWVDRSHSDSVKWNRYDKNVIPLWVADTDFASPPAVKRDLQQRVAEGVFGYGSTPDELVQLVIERLQQRYQWSIKPEWIVWMPAVVSALNIAVRAFSTQQDSIFLPTPIYPPFIQAAQHEGRKLRPLATKAEAGRWVTDLSSQDSEIDGSEKLLMLCNPNNPTGTVFRREELLQHLAFAQQHQLVVCSDEIHSDLILEQGLAHIPFASLNDDAAQRSITLLSPSKTFSIAGLGASMAIIPNPLLRQQFNQAKGHILPDINLLAYVAATAAYREGDEWLEALLEYLRANRALAMARINAMSGLSMLNIEGTYLGWIDTTQTGITDPYRFFLDAGVALTSGKDFGNPAFVRINLGCRRALLQEALDRMEAALNAA